LSSLARKHSRDGDSPWRLPAVAQLERALIRQIILKIPDRMPTVAPACRAGGGCGLNDLGRRLDSINYEVADAFRDLFGAMRAGNPPPPYPTDQQRRATV
jgi:hypothetical protein